MAQSNPRYVSSFPIPICEYNIVVLSTCLLLLSFIHINTHIYVKLSTLSDMMLG